jgi:hypothetical protein
MCFKLLFEHLCLGFYNQGAVSGGTTCPQNHDELRSTSCFIAPPERRAPEASQVYYARHVRNYVHKIMLQFYVYFCVFLPPYGHLISLCPASSLSCAIISQTGLLEVPVTYLGSLDYFLAQDPALPNDCSLKKLMLNGESRSCSLLSLVLYLKRVYFTSLTLTAEYSGSGRPMPLNKAITKT